VKLLLDTATFLWYITGDNRLPVATRALVRDPEHDVWLSVISVWEIAVKQQIGRLLLPAPADTFIPAERDRHGVASLPLQEAAVGHLLKLPDFHRDPFDRMLVCQAIEHDLLLVSGDDQVRRYPIKSIWVT
jgi:PIN domain nuclease of toxin-antitoxin system